MNIYLLKLTILSLGVSGWITYSILWLTVRIHGSMNLSFGVWGPSWIHWFETWIEPVILVGILALLIWALLHEMKRTSDRIIRRTTDG